MKKLHKKIIARALAGAIVLGGALQYGGVVAYANQVQMSDMARINYGDLKKMRAFLESRRDLFVLKVPRDMMDPVISRNYNSFEDFKREVVKLPKGYYLVHSSNVSIKFYKK